MEYLAQRKYGFLADEAVMHCIIVVVVIIISKNSAQIPRHLLFPALRLCSGGNHQPTCPA